MYRLLDLWLGSLGSFWRWFRVMVSVAEKGRLGLYLQLISMLDVDDDAKKRKSL